MTRPDCYLTDSLPQGFETDFRAWVTYDNMAARAHTPEQEAALQDYAQRVLIHGPLTKDNLDAFLDFYRCGAEESEREKRSAEAFREMPRGFDFAVDGPLIWAAFLQTYGIDLRTAQLHWWDFMALFRSLPDECRICKIISYRTEDLTDMPKGMREQYEKLRRVYALPAEAAARPGAMCPWQTARRPFLPGRPNIRKSIPGGDAPSHANMTARSFSAS